MEVWSHNLKNRKLIQSAYFCQIQATFLLCLAPPNHCLPATPVTPPSSPWLGSMEATLDKWHGASLGFHQNWRTSECIHRETHVHNATGSPGESRSLLEVLLQVLLDPGWSPHPAAVTLSNRGIVGGFRSNSPSFQVMLQGADTCGPQQDQELSLSWGGRREVGPRWKDSSGRWTVLSEMVWAEPWGLCTVVASCCLWSAVWGSLEGARGLDVS